MTPKEKAKELVERFINYAGHNSFLDSHTQRDYAKQCALICVDELIKFTIEKKEESMYFEMDLKYWQEVKQEI